MAPVQAHAYARPVNGDNAAVLVALLDLQDEETPVVAVERVIAAVDCGRERTVLALKELQQAGVVFQANFRSGPRGRVLAGWHAERQHAEALLREHDSAAVLGALLDLQCEELPVVAIERIGRTAGRDRETTVDALRELQEQGIVSISTFRYDRGQRFLTGWRAEREQAETLLRQWRLSSHVAPGVRLSGLAQL